MKLSYQDIFTPGSDRVIVDAEITTDHPASSYGQPVIVLADGGALGLTSWVCLGYQVVEATPEETEALEKMGVL